jgi:hypothetical protein
MVLNATFSNISTSDQDCQLLAHGRWFSPITPTSSTTITGHDDIAEILLKVALRYQNQIKIYFLGISNGITGK